MKGTNFILEGVNDFKYNYPHLCEKYWDYSKNTKQPSEVCVSDNRLKFWFNCDEGHSFQKTIKSFIHCYEVNAHACPVCSGRQFLSGFNDLATKRKELLEYWDYDKNSEDPSNVFYNNRDKKFWFLCHRGHSFQSFIRDVARSYTRKYKGCPVCAGKKIISGDNDFETHHPELALLWDYDKNDVLPSQVNYKDRINSFWFICEYGHSFQSIPQNLVDRQKFRSKGCPVCSSRVVVPEVNDILTLFPDRMKEWRYDLNDIDPSTLASNSTYEMTAVCGTPGCCNTYKVEVQYWVRGNVNNCEEHRLVLNGRSEACKNLADLIRSWGISVEEEVSLFNDRQSLDIFLPDLNIAIEYNGLVWHTEENRGKYYHYDKYRKCQEIGVNLLYVWEDDWLFNRQVTESLLKVKLGVGDSLKINARDCVVSEVNTDIAREFLNSNHIQGFVSGEAYLSLQINGNTCALMVIDGIEDAIYIKRYATSCSVRGGFSKLLKYAERTYSFSHFYTFSDNGISQGDLYSRNGFNVERYLEPDYSYLIHGKRVHKFNYRKDRFRSDENLIFQEGLTERELADINGISRIWDAGKIKWVKYI